MELDCQSCDEVLKRERGCNGESLVAWRLDNKTFRRCPLKLILPEAWEYIQAYSFLQKNMLPQGKGWLAESQKFLDAMSLIDSEMAAIEKEKIKTRKRKHGKK